MGNQAPQVAVEPDHTTNEIAAFGLLWLCVMDVATWEVVAQSPHVVALSPGQPHTSLLPIHMLSRATETAAATQDVRDMLQYAYNLGPRGFLSALAAFLSRQYKDVKYNYVLTASS
jgi:DNA-binding transcriptional MocR family regulator